MISNEINLNGSNYTKPSTYSDVLSFGAHLSIYICDNLFPGLCTASKYDISGKICDFGTIDSAIPPSGPLLDVFKIVECEYDMETFPSDG